LFGKRDVARYFWKRDDEMHRCSMRGGRFLKGGLEVSSFQKIAQERKVGIQKDVKRLKKG